MADAPARKPIPLGPFDVMSTWMFADPVAGATKRPSLRVRVVGNVPRLTVKTNVPDDKNYGRIDFQTDLETFAVILYKLEELARGNTDDSYIFEYNDHIFVNGQRSEKPLTIASVRIGKDRDTGRIYIAVLAHNRPKIQFFFGPSQYHALKRGDGSEISAGEVSAAYAVGWVRSMGPLVHQLLVTNFDEDARNVAKPQGPGGSGQQRAGGGSGYQKKHQSSGGFDDDITDFDDF